MRHDVSCVDFVCTSKLLASKVLLVDDLKPNTGT